MTAKDKHSNTDDFLTFAAESDIDDAVPQKAAHRFKLLIVDDEKEVHTMTRLVLADYCFKGSGLQFLSAYSGAEAKKLISDNPDAACILLDVVMEANDSGLEVARFIREDEKNDRMRIILRTGQPGKAPEKEIILNYDINDYKEKTELTAQKLFTCITTALRSYLHLVDLDKKTRLIAEKNSLLNEEITRRIMAESNLTKYNRSLEKMINNKSDRLKAALKALDKKEKQLSETRTIADVGNVSAVALTRLDGQGDRLKKNLATMDQYRTHMTRLIEKYDILQQILSSHAGSAEKSAAQTRDILYDINRFKKDTDLDEVLKNYPEIIKDSARGIDAVSTAVNDILLFISIRNEPKKKTDLNTLLKSAANRVKHQFKDVIDLQTDFNTLPEIPTAQKNMENAFYEILKNAFQAIKSHGIVSVSTAFEDPDIIVSVSDMGQGIAEQNLEHIFKPYVTLNKDNARGLGLAFAKSVITDHSGTIRVTSVLNEGTTVTVAIDTEKPDI